MDDGGFGRCAPAPDRIVDRDRRPGRPPRPRPAPNCSQIHSRWATMVSQGSGASRGMGRLVTGRPPTGHGGTGRRLLITVGISRYQRLGEENQLLRATGDAARIRELFNDFGYPNAGLALGDYSSAEYIKRTLSHWARDVELTEHDVVVFYFAGHGMVEGRDRHYLFCWDSDERDPAATALASEDVVRVLAAAGCRNLLLILDACYGGVGTADAARYALRAVAHRLGDGSTSGGMWFLSSARAKDEAEDGAFVDALVSAVETVTARTGQRQRYLDLTELVEQVNTTLAHTGAGGQRAELAAGLSTGLAPFFANHGYQQDLPAVGTDLETQRLVTKRDLYDHFGPRSRGVEFESEQGLYFSGRDRLLRELVGWLTAGRDDGKGRIVTGSPGCGKSAVLGRVVTLSDSEYRRHLGVDALATDMVVPENCVDAAVHARHKRLEEVVQQIASVLGHDVEGPGDLLREVSRRTADGESVVIVVDALDEAGSGTAADTGGRGEPRRIARELLRPLSDIPGVRLLVGTRRELVSSLGNGTMKVFDLDREEYLGSDDVAGYVRKVLLAKNEPHVQTPYRALPELAEEVARAVAARADRVFLVARMTARSLRGMETPIDTGVPGWQNGLPSEIGEAFDDYLARFEADEPRVRRLLVPLAFAEGQGLPRGSLWSRLVTAISGVSCTQEDIDWLLSKASAYVAEVVEDDRSVYRLYHQALAEHLRADPGLFARDTQRRIVDALRGAVSSASSSAGPDWFAAHSYVRAHLATHAAAAGVLSELVRDPGFLLAAEQLALLQAFSNAPTGTTGSIRTAYEQVAHLLTTSRPLGERAAYLQLSARRCQCGDLATRIDELDLLLPWSARWAVWSPTGAHRQLIGHESAVTAIAAGALDGRPIAVTGSSDGTARVWDLITHRQIGQPLEAGREVKCVAMCDLGEYSLALTGGDDGSVSLWDLSTGRQTRPPLRGHTNVVQAVTTYELSGEMLAATASADGTVRVWELASGRQRGDTITGHGGGVTGVVCAELGDRPVLITAGDDSRARIWDLRTYEPVGELIGHTGAVTGVAVGEVGGRVVVATVSQDSTAGLWDLATRQQIGEPLRLDVYGGGGGVALGRVDANPVLVVSKGPVAELWNPESRRPVGQPLTGHTNWVLAVATTSVNGRPVVITGGADGTARIWDLTSEQPLAAHSGTVRTVALSDLGGRTVAVTGSDDTTARIWDLDAGRQDGSPLVGHQGPVSAVAFVKLRTGPAIITAGNDTTIRVWDSVTRRQLGAVLSGHTNRVSTLALWSHEGRDVLVTGSHDGTVRLWDLDSREQVGEPLVGYYGDIQGLATGRWGTRQVVIATGRQGAHAWDLAERTSVAALDLHDEALRPVAVGCVGESALALLVRGDGALLLHDLGSAELPATPFAEPRHRVVSATFGQVRGRTVVLAADTRGDVFLLSVPDGEKLGRTLRGHNGAPQCLAVGEINGAPTAVTCRGTEVRHWDLTTGEQVGEPLSGHTVSVNAAAIARVGGRPTVALVGADNTIRMRDLESGDPVGSHVTGHMGEVRDIALLVKDDHLLAVTGGVDYSARLHDLTTGSETARLVGHMDWVRGVCTGTVHGRSVVLSASDDEMVYVWDVVTRQRVAELSGHKGYVYSAVVGDIDGHPVVVTGGDDGARLWDLAAAEQLGRPIGPLGGSVSAVALGVMGGRTVVLTGDSDGVVDIWDALTHERVEMSAAMSHTAPISKLALEHQVDATRLVVGSEDGAVRMWNLDAGTLVGELQLGAGVNDVALGPDSFLCVATDMGVVAFTHGWGGVL
ncbi:caspase family protein [Streptomyces sp. NPDC048275]|uniref:caspase family protein n=1 Tax=Streptomyces sp. NPDC048275 TaxID=3155629 RepID=UPI003407B4F9